MCPIGPERSLLEPSADACKRVFLDSPILCPVDSNGGETTGGCNLQMGPMGGEDVCVVKVAASRNRGEKLEELVFSFS